MSIDKRVVDDLHTMTLQEIFQIANELKLRVSITTECGRIEMTMEPWEPYTVLCPYRSECKNDAP